MNCERQYQIDVTASVAPTAWWKLNELADPRVDSISAVQLNSINATVITSAAAVIDRGSVHLPTAPATPAVLYSGVIPQLAYAGNGFEIFGWMRLVDAGTQQMQLNYLKASSQAVVNLKLDAFNNFVLDVFGDAIPDTINYPTVVAVGTWYFVRIYYDSVTQKFGIQIGDQSTLILGAVMESIAIPLSAQATMALALTAAFATKTCMFDEVGIFFQKLTDAQAAAIWNNGLGSTFG
jgi:hypothetical protein